MEWELKWHAMHIDKDNEMDIRVEGVRSIHSPNNVIVYASIDLDSV